MGRLESFGVQEDLADCSRGNGLFHGEGTTVSFGTCPCKYPYTLTKQPQHAAMNLRCVVSVLSTTKYWQICCELTCIYCRNGFRCTRHCLRRRVLDAGNIFTLTLSSSNTCPRRCTRMMSRAWLFPSTPPARRNKKKNNERWYFIFRPNDQWEPIIFHFWACRTGTNRAKTVKIQVRCRGRLQTTRGVHLLPPFFLSLSLLLIIHLPFKHTPFATFTPTTHHHYLYPFLHNRIALQCQQITWSDPTQNTQEK